METNLADAIAPMVYMFVLVLLLGYLATPLLMWIFYRSARAAGVKVSVCIGLAYWMALFLPWCYLMARIDGARIPRGVTIAMYTTLYVLWIGMTYLYVFWAFNAIEYNYAYEARGTDRTGVGFRTSVAFIAAVAACCITLIYSLFGLLFERFSSFGEGGNEIKQMFVPTSRDAFLYAVGLLWIPLLFSADSRGYMTMLAIVFVAWRALCRHKARRPAANAERQALAPDWREALPFAFFAMWILMFPVMWGFFYGIGSS